MKLKIVNNIAPLPCGTNQAVCGPAATPCPSYAIFVLADSNQPLHSGLDHICTTISGNTVYDSTNASINSLGSGISACYFVAGRTSGRRTR